ncbi:DMT family transporter [Pseudodesulfovibrio thermohalotolerans]|uniref:DMT family transporter n=1 Tax=Pseudodesulfovibrio thermohalotolerans TaxID=2880651 RepID=UPI002442FF2B|nr:DMT family transporter [Pseudodesulfovibrio thermohalotolerans]WFS63706.1 DMT family transporter [Pseudodesulfovibrio thermohalotolerans]
MVFIEGKTRALAALWAAVLLWASSFIVLKIAFQRFDPMVVIFGRMFVASLCFLLVFKNLRRIDYQPGDWKLLAFMGICEPGLYFVFEAMALTYTDASQAGMICALLPLMVAVAARLTLKEPLKWRTVAGFCLAIVGAVILSSVAEPTATASNPTLGNFLEFLAMVCACGYMISLKKLTPRYSPWFLTMVQAFVGSAFYFPLLFLPSTELPTAFDFTGVAAVLYLGVFVSLGAYGMYNYGMSKIPTAQASAFINLIPVITLGMGFVLLGERLNWMQYAASALVIAGVYVSQDAKSKKAASTD